MVLGKLVFFGGCHNRLLVMLLPMLSVWVVTDMFFGRPDLISLCLGHLHGYRCAFGFCAQLLPDGSRVPPPPAGPSPPHCYFSCQFKPLHVLVFSVWPASCFVQTILRNVGVAKPLFLGAVGMFAGFFPCAVGTWACFFGSAISVLVCFYRMCWVFFFVPAQRSLRSAMEDIVDLETSNYPSTQFGFNADCDFGPELLQDRTPAQSAPQSAKVGGRGGLKSSSSTSLPQTDAAQKFCGPNWTESEMMVFIAQKRIEWDGRHNSNQPSLAKFVYGTTMWRLVLAGCMSVVGFRPRDADQITNKWDGLIKDYKKLKEYIEGTGSSNWWGLSREEKKVLSKTR